MASSVGDKTAETKESPDDSSVCLIDHVVYHCHDLDATIAKFSDLLGVKPIVAGHDAKKGSWNALFSLGNNTYFELLAPDPSNKTVIYKSSLKDLASSLPNGEGIVTYMVRVPSKYSSKLDQFIDKTMNDTNYHLGQTFGGQREAEIMDHNKNVTKHTIKWDILCQKLLIKDSDEKSNQDHLNFFKKSEGVFPYFIDWKDMKQTNGVYDTHPSNTSPKGCKLVSIECFHPSNDKIGNVLNKMNMDERWSLKFGEKKKIQVKIQTPNGKVVLV